MSEAAGGRAAPVRYTRRLPGQPASAAAARQTVRSVLRAAGRSEWIDAAELACTEVVSNVVLHAHTDLELTIEVTDELARVEVRDFSPVLPVQRDYSRHATTGRGMALVAALTAEHGIADVGPTGKTVWFTVTGEPAAQSDDDLLAAWHDADWDLEELLEQTAVDDTGATRTVRLLQLPPTLWLAAREHHDALVRELVLYLAQHDGPAVDVEAADRARATVSTAVVGAVQRAQESGAARRILPVGHPSPLPDVPAPLDLELHVPPELGPAFAALQDTLDAAERLAAAGLLLVRPGLPEVIAVRDWACEQVTAQLAGVAPSPWPGADQERFALEADPGSAQRDLPEWDVAALGDADRGVVAADQANRIIAVSRPLADALGWSDQELVGRRVVTLIPPRLREAHVAGFTRHLTTGEAHALGVPLTLPVLRADGTELLADFLIQQVPVGAGRAVYIAEITPHPAAHPAADGS